MIEANRFKLGLFVVIGLLLFGAALFFLGVSEIFKKKAKMVTLFKESVQGLNVGSEVKFKGVPIGSVSKISIRVKDQLIRVDMDVNINAFDTTGKTGSQEHVFRFFRKFFEREIDQKGLKCQLAYAGITGLKYIEIDFADHDDNEVILTKGKIKQLELAVGDNVIYIPSTTSMFSDIVSQIGVSLGKISKIPFDKISKDFAASVEKANKILDNKKIGEIIDNVENATKSLEKSIAGISKVLTEDNIREISDGVKKSLGEIHELLKDVRKDIEGSKLVATTASFRNAAESVDQAKRALINTLMKLDQTLDSITELVNFIDDNPSALIRGKDAPLVMPVDRDVE